MTHNNEEYNENDNNQEHNNQEPKHDNEEQYLEEQDNHYNINNELENTIANDMAYNFGSHIIKSQPETRQMLDIVMRYGLSEKAGVLMLMEFGTVQEENDHDEF
ncbi:hypothetical protein ABDK10_05410 [Staphylococcus aureus]